MPEVEKLQVVGKSATLAWTKHWGEWCHCQKCPLGSGATNHVLARGTLPCDVLFIGEAPGESEDAVGYPFVGRAGKVLDIIIEAAWLRLPGRCGQQPKWTYAIANILACIPRPDDANTAFRQPTKEEAKACSPRLEELIDLANPKGIVLLGKVAVKYRPKYWEGATLELQHPSYILRTGGANPSNGNFTKAVLQLKRFLGEIL